MNLANDTTQETGSGNGASGDAAFGHAARHYTGNATRTCACSADRRLIHSNVLERTDTPCGNRSRAEILTGNYRLFDHYILYHRRSVTNAEQTGIRICTRIYVKPTDSMPPAIQ